MLDPAIRVSLGKAIQEHDKQGEQEKYDEHGQGEEEEGCRSELRESMKKSEDRFGHF